MWLKPGRYFRRDHRKLITIDSTLAFTGGLNVANEYWGTTFRKKRPWRDTGVLMQGPVAAELTVRFFDAWCKLCKQPDSFNGSRTGTVRIETYGKSRPVKRRIFNII